ncbi:hypothetical protein JCM5353_007933 [Sporobolomyces roseus]
MEFSSIGGKRIMSAAELQEQQERLTALVNVLGFTSLDHLEDFVILHGAARVVPASSIAAAGASLPLDETQTQGNLGTSYTETKHAQRNEERRKENKRLKSEVEEVRKEVAWLRNEHEKHVDAIERLGKDKTRLLDLIDELSAKVEAAREGGSETDSDELASLAEEASALYDRLDELEDIIAELDDQNRILEEQRRLLEEENREKSEAYDESVANNLQIQTELEEVWLDKTKLEDEYEDLKSKIGALSAIVSRPTSASASRSTPQVGSASIARPTRPLPRSGLSNSTTPAPLHRAPTQLRDSTPSSASHKTPQAPASTSSVPPIASAAQSPSPALADGTASSSSSTTHPLPSSHPPASISAALSRSSVTIRASRLNEKSSHSPSPIPVPVPTPVLTHVKASTPISASSTKLDPPPSTSIPASTMAASSSSSRITSVQARQLKQYPQVLSSYISVINGISSQQAWVLKIKPNLTPSLLSSLTAHPPLSIHPSPEFPNFPTLPTLQEGHAQSRPAWIADGTLQRRYEGLEDAERRAVQRSAQWRNWIRLAKVKIEEEVVSQQKASRVVETTRKGKGKEKEVDTETPKGMKVLVKKKRRISKEGQEGTPTSSTSAATSTSTSRPLRSSLAPSTSKNPTSSASSATAVQPRTSSPFVNENDTAARADRPPPTSTHGDTQLPPSPEGRRAWTGAPEEGPSTAKKRKWNLLSPSKKTKATPEFVSRQELLKSPHKSPRKASPVKRSGPSILVDNTQPILPTRQTSHPSSDAATSEYGAEPDTLRSTEEGEPDTIRSSEGDAIPPRRILSRSVSRSPQKKGSQVIPNLSPVKMSPLRRTVAVSHDSSSALPKPPFSPAYAARMHQKAKAAASLPIRPSPSRPPFRPSPNGHSRSSRSPSSSPVKRDLSMPPSAQPARFARQVASPASKPVAREDSPDEEDTGRGLLFSNMTSTSPMRRGKGKSKAIERENENVLEVKEEEVDADTFNDSRQPSGRSKKQPSRSVSSSPRKSKRKSGYGQARGEGENAARSSKRSKRTTNSTATQAGLDEEKDVKPVVRGQAESIGEMPMGSDQEEARKLWVRKIQAARHEQVLKAKKEKEQQKRSPRVQLELNPNRNQGQTHAFKQTKRNKAVQQTTMAEGGRTEDPARLCKQSNSAIDRALYLEKNPHADPRLVPYLDGSSGDPMDDYPSRYNTARN